MRPSLLIIMLFIYITSKSQNLVINPSFEDTLSCFLSPTYGPENAPPWYSASGSPDFFSSMPSPCITNNNNILGFQVAQEGNNYSGFAIYISSSPDTREYVGGKLNDTLKAGHSYCLSFWVNAANKLKFHSDDIGAYLSIDSIYNSMGGNPVLPYLPQIENTQGNILTDTVNWMLISGSFVAQGGEKYICIGNFKNDSTTTLDSIATYVFPDSYYFIDNVSLVDCTVGINDFNKGIEQLLVYPNPTSGKISLKYNFKENEKIEIKVYDLPGSLVMQKNISENNYLDISQLYSGVYLINFVANGKQYYEKITLIK